MLDILKGLKIHISFLLFAFFGGAVGYHFLYPEAAWNKLFFMTAITLSTVGYGDVLNVEQSTAGTLFTMILMLVGLSIVLYSVSAITATFIEGNLGKLIKLKALYRRIAKMKNHYIVCGIGQTGTHVVSELESTQKEFVVIEMNSDLIAQYQQTHPNINFIEGDATNEEILEKANIANAQGVIATLPNDKENLFLVITARMMNTKLKIASKAIQLSMVSKLRKAGANYVVTPNFIGGMRIASELLRPNVVSFLDKMLRGKDKSVRVGEITIQEDSKFIGRSLKEINPLQTYGLNILAINTSHKKDDFIYNPCLDTELAAGDVLIFVASLQQQQKIEADFQH